jgi:hypothetical protein
MPTNFNEKLFNNSAIACLDRKTSKWIILSREVVASSSLRATKRKSVISAVNDHGI